MTSRSIMPCPSPGFLTVPTLLRGPKLPRLVLEAGCDRTGRPGLGRSEGQRRAAPQRAPSLYPPFPPAVCCILSKAAGRRLHPAHRLLLLGMAGYLSETDFVMVEEGFSTRDLLEELTLGASQATAVRDWE